MPPFEGLLSACHTQAPVEGFLRLGRPLLPGRLDPGSAPEAAWPERSAQAGQSQWTARDWPARRSLSLGESGRRVCEESDLRGRDCRCREWALRGATRLDGP